LPLLQALVILFLRIRCFYYEPFVEDSRGNEGGPFEFSWKTKSSKSSAKKQAQLHILRSTHTATHSEAIKEPEQEVSQVTQEVLRHGKPSLKVISADDHDMIRQFDCTHYNTCLGLAAALNWESFTCGSCSGRLNNQLFWRAHQFLKKDDVLAKLCDLPTVAAVQQDLNGLRPERDEADTPQLSFESDDELTSQEQTAANQR